MSNAKSRLLELVEKRKAEQAKKLAAESAGNSIKSVAIPQPNTGVTSPLPTITKQKIPVIPGSAIAPSPVPNTVLPAANSGNNGIVYNEEQTRAIEYAKEGAEFCLIGAAGTGKTTTVKQVVRTFIDRYKDPVTGHAPIDSIALVSFTNRAVRNIAKAVADIGAESYCITIHKFLGFHPEELEYYDENGERQKTMRFVPEYTADKPKPSCRLVVIDESSMVSTELYGMLKAACPNALFIFIGDLNQLPPVMGDAILGYKLGELPVVELTKVYRQAMESPIIRFQHEHTLKGKDISDTELAKINEGKYGAGLKFHAFKKELPDPEVMAEVFAKHMCKLMDIGEYDWRQDTILIPYNKQFGTVLVNKWIAEHVSQTTGAVVYEIIAGRNTFYYAVGDFLMYDKKEYVIDSITENPRYVGKNPMAPSEHLSRFGYLHKGGSDISSLLNKKLESATDAFELLLQATGPDSEEDVKNQGSHILKLRPLDDLEEKKLSDSQLTEVRTSGEYSKSDWGYSMTVHKSQGSEWRKVWLVMTNKHKAMLTRECLYTGMTRAKEELTVFYSKQTTIGKRNGSIAKAIRRAEIPGVGWKEKVKYFFAKQKNNGQEGSARNGMVKVTGVDAGREKLDW